MDSFKHDPTDTFEIYAADPLPDDKIEGDSADTEVWDENDTPPGVDPRTGEDFR